MTPFMGSDIANAGPCTALAACPAMHARNAACEKLLLFVLEYSCICVEVGCGSSIVMSCDVIQYRICVAASIMICDVIGSCMR